MMRCTLCSFVQARFYTLCVVVYKIIVISCFMLSIVLCYWLLFDTAPIVEYGPHSYVTVTDNALIIHIDGVKVRNCPAKVYSKIIGCIQYDFAPSDAVALPGTHIAPVIIKRSVFDDVLHDIHDINATICTMIRRVEGYCNTAQQLFGIPIINQAPPINFIYPIKGVNNG